MSRISAGLWAHRLCMPSSCSAARVARFAVTQPSSWAAAIKSQLQQIGVPDPLCGIAPNAPSTVMHRCLQHAIHLTDSHSLAHFQAVAQNTSLLQYMHWQPRPRLHPIVYGQQTCPSQARFGGLPDADIMTSRMDGRSARNRHADPLTACRLCAVGIDSLRHVLLSCSAHQNARQRWMQQSGGCPVIATPALQHQPLNQQRARYFMQHCFRRKCLRYCCGM